MSTLIATEDQVVEFLNILRQYGTGSSEAEAFKARFPSDPVFAKRASVAEKLFANKKLIIAELDRLDAADRSKKK